MRKLTWGKGEGQIVGNQFKKCEQRPRKCAKRDQDASMRAFAEMLAPPENKKCRET